jgi:hypothetical protein
MHIMSTNKLIIMFLRIFNIFLHFVIQHKAQFLRSRNIRSSNMFRSMVDGPSCDRRNDKFVHSQSGRSVHAGVFTYKKEKRGISISISISIFSKTALSLLGRARNKGESGIEPNKKIPGEKGERETYPKSHSVHYQTQQADAYHTIYSWRSHSTHSS